MNEAMNEAVRALSAEETVELIGSHIEARLNGGPNRKAEDIELGRKVGLNTEQISTRWDEAERVVSASQAIAQKISEASAKPKPLALLPLSFAKAMAKPKPPINAVADMGPPKIKVAPSVSGEPKAEPERLREAIEAPKGKVDPRELAKRINLKKSEAAEIRWTFPELNEPPIFVRKAPMDNAKLFARDMLTFQAAEKHALGTYFFGGEWWQWNGAFYDRAPRQRIIDLVCRYLDMAKVKSNEEGLVRFRPLPKDASDLFKFLESNAGIDDRDGPPRWLDERDAPDARKLLAFRNCLVDVTTGETYPHEPLLWAHDGLGYDYDPNAKCPKWEWFLEDLFPGDVEAQTTIEEQLGYGMTWDNRFEKIALWVGPTRSGRGTLAAIQELLVGPTAHIPLDIHTWNSTENSKQDMIGKKVGIFHDVRLKEPKAYGAVSYDPGGLDHKSIQALLEFSSGDATRLGQKHIRAWVGKPLIKIIMISNKVPNFRDLVLPDRFIMIEFKKSNLGKEDHNLKTRTLPAEISGIAYRCLAAYRRLLERDHFIQPKSGLRLLTSVKEITDPWLAFMNAYWEPGEDGVSVKVFNAVFRYWAKKQNRLDLINTNSSNVIQNINQIKEWQYLHSFRRNSEPRLYAVKFKKGAVTEEMADTIKLDGKSVPELRFWGRRESSA